MFQLWPTIFFIPLEIQSHIVPHWKALGYCKLESKGLSCGSISKGVWKVTIYGNSGLFVSIANVNSHDNSGPCVSIVNSTIMATLAFVSALPMSTVITTLAHVSTLWIQSSWKLWPCVRIVNSIIMTTLALVPALSTQSSWQLWPLCQHCQLNHHGISGLFVSIANVSSHDNSGPCISIVNSIIMATLALCQHCQLNHRGNSGPCVSIVSSNFMASLANVSTLSIWIAKNTGTLGAV